MKTPKNNYTFKLWIILTLCVLGMLITMLSGKGEGLQIWALKIRPISEGAVSAIYVLLANVLYPLVRDVVGNSNNPENTKQPENEK